MQNSLLMTKKDICSRLGISSVLTLNQLISRGCIPGPLPGSKFLYWPAVLAGLERSSGKDEPEVDNSPLPRFLAKGVKP